MKNAFTLAEVLLTLAIIGVVAALTIPAVITKVTQDQYVVGLKKAYNTLKAVEREAVQENGEMANWDWSGGDKKVFETYFKSHFDILRDCGIETADGCFVYTAYTKYLNGAISGWDVTGSRYYKIITSDGISYALSTINSYPGIGRKAAIVVDVNGKKAPNITGRDIYWFNVFPELGIKPYGSYAVDTAEPKSGDGNCVSSGTGNECTTKVLAEGAMNY